MINFRCTSCLSGQIQESNKTADDLVKANAIIISNKEIAKKYKATIKAQEDQLTQINNMVEKFNLELTEKDKIVSGYVKKVNELEANLHSINKKTDDDNNMEYEDGTTKNYVTFDEMQRMFDLYGESILRKVDEKIVTITDNNNEQATKRKKPNNTIPDARSAQGESLSQNIIGNMANMSSRENFPIRLVRTNNLKPPPIKTRAKKSIYEVFVTKFDKSVTATDISNHIMENTDIITPELYKVELITSLKRNQEVDYISFKVSTFGENIYNAVMDEKLWAPNYVARDFVNYEDGKKTPRPRQNNEKNWSNNIIDTPSMKKGLDRRNNLRRNLIKYDNNNRSAQQNYNVTPRYNKYDNGNRFRSFPQNNNVKWKDVEQSSTPNRRINTPRTYTNKNDCIPKYQYMPIYAQPQQQTFQPQYVYAPYQHFLDRHQLNQAQPIQTTQQKPPQQ